jgi:TusA-related sulfurtransferase
LKQKPDYTLDFRGTITSITLLKASRIFREMRPREIIMIKGCDSDTRTDLFKVLPNASYELIDVDGDNYNMERLDCFHIRKQ